jgi:hypothetical protein
MGGNKANENFHLSNFNVRHISQINLKSIQHMPDF